MAWSEQSRRAAAERMRKLNADRWKPPVGYESLYRKTAAIIGAKAARIQIETLARNASKRAANNV